MRRRTQSDRKKTTQIHAIAHKIGQARRNTTTLARRVGTLQLTRSYTYICAKEFRDDLSRACVCVCLSVCVCAQTVRNRDRFQVQGTVIKCLRAPAINPRRS